MMHKGIIVYVTNSKITSFHLTSSAFLVSLPKRVVFMHFMLFAATTVNWTALRCRLDVNSEFMLNSRAISFHKSQEKLKKINCATRVTQKFFLTDIDLHKVSVCVLHFMHFPFVVVDSFRKRIINHSFGDSVSFVSPTINSRAEYFSVSPVPSSRVTSL